MRIVVCGDTHIGAIYGLGKPNGKGSNTRIDDYATTLNYIVDYCISNKIDIFIQTGDTFDIRTPPPEQINIVNDAIKKLALANISSIVIMGNHDYKKSGETFTSSISSLAAKDYPNVRILIEPEILKFYDKESAGVNVLLMPYRDRRMYVGKTTEEDSALYEQQARDLLSVRDVNLPTIAVGHNFYYENSYSEFGGAEVLIKPSTFQDCDMVTMGHHHNFKIVSKKSPVAFYVGSMDKINFGDEKNTKYFLDYDTVTKKTNIIKIPSRELLDLSVDLIDSTHENFYQKFEDAIKDNDLKDKIIRVKIIVSESLMSFIKKPDLEKIILSSKCFYLSKILIEPIITRVYKDSGILDEKDDLSMFKAFLASQDFDVTMEEELLNEARIIMGV
jgi:exonuclease SbcD